MTIAILRTHYYLVVCTCGTSVGWHFTVIRRTFGKNNRWDEHNTGYFEWDAVVALQERLLIDLQRWWPAPEGTLPLPDGWLEHQATRDTYLQLRELLSTAVNHQQNLWAIKDPRSSRLLPLWMNLCQELDIPLRLLLAVRDPAEVVTSLVRRDGPITGMDSNRAQQLWWRHNLEVVQTAHAAEISLPVVDFQCWFDEPERQLDALIEALPSLQPSAKQREQALALIEPDHRRSMRRSGAPELHPALRRLHKRLLRTPLSKRMPDPSPPQQLIRKLTQHNQISGLASVGCWDVWLHTIATTRRLGRRPLHTCQKNLL